MATIPLLKTYCPHKSKAPVWVNFTRACWRLFSSFLLFAFFYFNLLFSSLFCNFVDLQTTVWVVHIQTSVLLLTLKFLNRRQQQALIILPFLCLVITSNILSVYKRNLSSFIDKCGNALCTEYCKPSSGQSYKYNFVSDENTMKPKHSSHSYMWFNNRTFERFLKLSDFSNVFN